MKKTLSSLVKLVLVITYGYDAVSIEDILLARSMADSDKQPDMGQGALIGAGLAGAAGIGYTDLAARLRPQTQMDVMPPRGYRLKPGHRMAGGLVGAILGGVWCWYCINDETEFTCCRHSCKTASTGELNAVDQQALQSILADTYSNTLGV